MNVIEANLAAIRQYLEPPKEAANIKPASTWCDQVIDHITNPSIDLSGVPIHYSYNHIDTKLRFRLGEVTIWAGTNGHGKSLFLNQFILSAIRDVKALIISPEMPVHKTMQRMTYQATRCRQPNVEQIKQFHQWTDGRLWLYDQLGTLSTQMVKAVIRYGVAELGISHFVVDSLMKCGMGDDDYNRQKRFVDELCAMSKDHNIHIHLVAHSRKGESEKRMPDKFDIKGSGTITDLVDNVMIIWRNKGKEATLEKEDISDDERLQTERKPDAVAMCRKQRHGDWEGNIGLWFHQPSMLFMDKKDAQPIPMAFTNQPVFEPVELAQ